MSVQYLEIDGEQRDGAMSRLCATATGFTFINMKLMASIVVSILME